MKLNWFRSACHETRLVSKCLPCKRTGFKKLLVKLNQSQSASHEMRPTRFGADVRFLHFFKAYFQQHILLLWVSGCATRHLNKLTESSWIFLVVPIAEFPVQTAVCLMQRSDSLSLRRRGGGGQCKQLNSSNTEEISVSA